MPEPLFSAIIGAFLTMLLGAATGQIVINQNHDRRIALLEKDSIDQDTFDKRLEKLENDSNLIRNSILTLNDSLGSNFAHLDLELKALVNQRKEDQMVSTQRFDHLDNLVSVVFEKVVKPGE